MTKYLKNKNISFWIAQKTIKYLGINLTEEVKDLFTDTTLDLSQKAEKRLHLFTEKNMILKKEIKKDTNKWKIFTFMNQKNK